MKKTRFIAILMLCMFSSYCLPSNVLGSSNSTDIATAVLGSTAKLERFSKIEMGDNTNYYPVKRNEQEGWLCDLTLGDAARYIYFDVDDKFLNKIDDGTSVEIEVEYFDYESGCFTLTYDGQNGESTNAEIVYLGVSNSWKTHVFKIDDAYFGNRFNGHDFRIGIHSSSMGKSPASVAFGSVKIKRYIGKNPIKTSLRTNEFGNVFCNADEKKFIVDFKSLLEESVEIDVLYEAVKDNGDVVWSLKDNISFEESEEITKNITMDFNEYGLFDFRVSLKNVEKQIDSQMLRPFSIVNSDNDGIVNKKFIFNTHMELRVNNVSAESELVAKSGAAGIRTGLAWDIIEYPKGSFRFIESMEKTLESIKKNNFDVTVLLAYGHTGYGATHKKYIPETDEQLKAWENYCEHVTSIFKDLGIHARFEVWNEPNYGAYGLGPVKYAKLCEVTYNAVKKVWPEAKVGIGSLTGLQGIADSWFIEMMDAGAYKYADAITLHPYKIGFSAKDIKMDETILNHYVAEFEKYDKDDIEVWNTEYGFSGSDYSGENIDIQRSRHIISSFVTLDAKGVCDTFEYYDLCKDGIVATNREHNFGVVNSANDSPNKVNFSATDPYVAITNMNYLLANANHVNTVSISEKSDAYIYDSERFHKKVAVIWSGEDTENASFRLDTNEVECYDSYGNKRIINGKDGVYTFYYGKDPFYIVGDFKSFEVMETGPLLRFEETSIMAVSGDIIEIETEKMFDEPASLEITSSDAIELIDVSEFLNNKSVIKLKATNSKGNVDKVIINTNVGNKIVQSTSLEISYKDAAEISLVAELPDKDNINQWDGIFYISNHSTTDTINGHIQFNKPVSWGRLKIPIGRIPAGLDAEVRFALPEIKEKEMFNIEGVLHLVDGRTVTLKKDIDFTVGLYAKSKPIIDGIIDDKEWNFDSAMYSVNPEQVKEIKNYGGINDLSAKTYVMWDEDYFYMASKVTDDVFYQPNTGVDIWAGDSIQVGIFSGKEGHIVIGQAGTAYTEIGIAKTSNGVEMYRWKSQDGSQPEGKITNFEGAVKRVDTHTCYEFKIPWSEVLPENTKVSTMEQLGFSMLVNDNDGNGRRGWIEYASGIGLSKNTALFTYIKLLK